MTTIERNGETSPAIRDVYDSVQVAITSLDSALSVLSGLSSGELAVLDGITAGTLLASKALIVDANKKINELDITALKINGASVACAANQASSTASDTAGIVADFNTLLGKLKTAGLMAADV